MGVLEGGMEAEGADSREGGSLWRTLVGDTDSSRPALVHRRHTSSTIRRYFSWQFIFVCPSIRMLSHGILASRTSARLLPVHNSSCVPSSPPSGAHGRPLRRSSTHTSNRHRRIRSRRYYLAKRKQPSGNRGARNMLADAEPCHRSHEHDGH